jgi:c-di-GMP-binding flagellar brake protein YcgR
MNSVLAPKVTVHSNKEAAREQLIDMDSVRWYIGEKLFLQMQDNPAVRYTVRMVGFVKNRSITIQAPVADGGNPAVRDGQIFIARAFTGKKAYAFTTEALKSVFFPYPHIHLSYPEQVRSTVIRQGSRVTVKIIASVEVGDAEQPSAIVLNDLSTGGASGVSSRPLGAAMDTGVIKFKVHVAENDEYLCLKTAIRSVELAENGEGFRYGFQFLELDTQQRLVLSAFVHHALVEVE